MTATPEAEVDEPRFAYLDSSAFVKLVAIEAESEALRDYLRAWRRRASVALLRTEALRAVRSHGAEGEEKVRAELSAISLIALSDELLERAGHLDPSVLRSLDAIHLAGALTLDDALGVVVTYDMRMADGARALGFDVAAPS